MRGKRDGGRGGAGVTVKKEWSIVRVGASEESVGDSKKKRDRQRDSQIEKERRYYYYSLIQYHFIYIISILVNTIYTWFKI